MLYTGSLVPKAIIDRARPDARVIDSAGLTLDEILSVIRAAHDADQDVARVHTGDPSIFGSTGEQMRRLQALGIGYDRARRLVVLCGGGRPRQRAHAARALADRDPHAR